MLANLASESVRITGIALDATDSVRAVRFEPAASCSVTTAGSVMGTVTASGNMTRDSSASELTVYVGGTGLAPQVYAVCIDYLANSAAGAFERVGNSTLLVGAC